jgi:hypothetical protein
MIRILSETQSLRWFLFENARHICPEPIEAGRLFDKIFAGHRAHVRPQSQSRTLPIQEYKIGKPRIARQRTAIPPKRPRIHFAEAIVDLIDDYFIRVHQSYEGICPILGRDILCPLTVLYL